MDQEKPQVVLVKSIADALCEQPDQIEIQDSVDEKGALIKLLVSKQDLPRMIGKGGDTAMAIRTLLRALGSRHNARYSFKVDSKAYSVGHETTSPALPQA